jgi:hypothetical protein
VRIGVAILVVLALSLPGVAHGEGRTYQTGNLVSVNSPELPFTLPPVVAGGPSITIPLHLSYEFEVRNGDIVYLGFCRRSDYKPEWRVGEDVQFRLQKDKMYLKRPNGKEFRLIFLLEAKLGADGQPTVLVNYKKR